MSRAKTWLAAAILAIAACSEGGAGVDAGPTEMPLADPEYQKHFEDYLKTLTVDARIYTGTYRRLEIRSDTSEVIASWYGDTGCTLRIMGAPDLPDVDEDVACRGGHGAQPAVFCRELTAGCVPSADRKRCICTSPATWADGTDDPVAARWEKLYVYPSDLWVKGGGGNALQDAVVALDVAEVKNLALDYLGLDAVLAGQPAGYEGEVCPSGDLALKWLSAVDASVTLGKQYPTEVVLRKSFDGQPGGVDPDLQVCGRETLPSPGFDPFEYTLSAATLADCPSLKVATVTFEPTAYKVAGTEVFAPGSALRLGVTGRAIVLRCRD